MFVSANTLCISSFLHSIRVMCVSTCVRLWASSIHCPSVGEEYYVCRSIQIISASKFLRTPQRPPGDPPELALFFLNVYVFTFPGESSSRCTRERKEFVRTSTLGARRLRYSLQALPSRGLTRTSPGNVTYPSGKGSLQDQSLFFIEKTQPQRGFFFQRGYKRKFFSPRL